MSKKFKYVAGYTTKKQFPDEEKTYHVLELECSDLEEGHYGALLLKKGTKTYVKDTVEMVANLFTESTTQRMMSMTKKDYDSNLNTDGINLEFVHMLHSLGMFMGYFINSTSWKEQDLKDFDSEEFKKRLQRVIQYF